MSSIMLNDLARMARDGSAPLIGRPITEPSALERANFMLTHNNMTPEQWQESQRQLQREAIEDKILMEYRGEIPGNVVADVRGLRGARCEWVRFKAWLARTTAELSELESTKARLSDIMSAPDKTAGVIGALISRTAAFLLGKGGADDDATERLELDKKLAAERHRSQAAAEALPEIERQIEVKQMQVEALQSREGEFLNPAMQDLLEASGVAKLLARRRAEVLALESDYPRLRPRFPLGLLQRSQAEAFRSLRHRMAPHVARCRWRSAVGPARRSRQAVAEDQGVTAMDDNCTSAFWLASRATHRVFTRAPIIELALSDPATVFRDARREATLMLAQQPTDESRATALLIGAHGVRRAGELPPNWLAMCVEIAGSPWPDRLPASAGIFVDHRWPRFSGSPPNFSIRDL